MSKDIYDEMFFLSIRIFDKKEIFLCLLCMYSWMVKCLCSQIQLITIIVNYE